MSLHKLWGSGLAVLCLFPLFASLSVHAGCPNTATFVIVILCSLRTNASPQLPLFQVRSFFPPHSEPQSDFLFFWRGKAAPWVAEGLAQGQGGLVVWLGSV